MLKTFAAGLGVLALLAPLSAPTATADENRRRIVRPPASSWDIVRQQASSGRRQAARRTAGQGTRVAPAPGARTTAPRPPATTTRVQPFTQQPLTRATGQGLRRARPATSRVAPTTPAPTSRVLPGQFGFHGSRNGVAPSTARTRTGSANPRFVTPGTGRFVGTPLGQTVQPSTRSFGRGLRGTTTSTPFGTRVSPSNRILPGTGVSSRVDTRGARSGVTRVAPSRVTGSRIGVTGPSTSATNRVAPSRRTRLLGQPRIDWRAWHARHNHPGRSLPIIRTAPHHPRPLPLPHYDGPYYDGPYYDGPVHVGPIHVHPQPVHPEPVVPHTHGQPLPGEAPIDPYTPRSVAFGKAADAFFAGDFVRAHGLFGEAITADPQDAEAWMGWVHTSLLLDRIPDAAEGITRVALLGGFPAGYRFDPRELFEDARPYEEAIRKLTRYTNRRPRDRDALTVLAWWQIATGQHTLADATLSRIKWHERDHPAVPHLRAANQPAPVEIYGPGR